MSNILKVLRRDALRLLKVPAAMVIVIALAIIPSAYTWYNVAGFWDPYGNTGNLSVCVVNKDAGGSSDLTGELDLGNLVLTALESNTQLKWTVASEDEAFDRLNRGESYAVLVLPEDFTANLLTLLTGDFTQPTIAYYVNEKMGPIAPKITDTGATTLDQTINTTFVTVASGVVISKFEEVAGDAQVAVSQLGSEASQKISQVSDVLLRMKAKLGALEEGLDAADEKLGHAQDLLDGVHASIALAAEGSAIVAEDASRANAQVQEALSQTREGIRQAQEVLGEIVQRGGDIGEAAQEASAKLDKLTMRLDTLALGSDELATGLGGIAGTLSATATALALMATQYGDIVTQAHAVLETLSQAVVSTVDLADSFDADAGTIRTDVLMLANSGILREALSAQSLDSAKIAAFIGKPTQVVTEKLYPQESFGVSMIPFFMNLTLWVGAFMLVIIFRGEVDTEGIKKLTMSQTFVARYLLLGAMAAAQAVVCCAGLVIVGLVPASVPAFFCAAIVASLAYEAIIYSLSVTLKHVGMGLCLVLIFAQIPAATGIYPIEMTSDFFQAIYPWFPLTYGINAIREAFCGFYGWQYAQCILALCAFGTVFVAAGLVFRPLLANVVRMFAEQVREGDVFAGEDVELAPRVFGATTLLKVLASNEEYRAGLEERYNRAAARYPKIVRAAIAVAVAVSTLVALFLTLDYGEKAYLLCIWVVLLAATVIVLLVMECARQRIGRELEVAKMDSAKAFELLSATKFATATAGSGASGKGGLGDSGMGESRTCGEEGDGAPRPAGVFLHDDAPRPADAPHHDGVPRHSSHSPKHGREQEKEGDYRG